MNQASKQPFKPGDIPVGHGIEYLFRSTDQERVYTIHGPIPQDDKDWNYWESFGLIVEDSQGVHKAEKVWTWRVNGSRGSDQIFYELDGKHGRLFTKPGKLRDTYDGEKSELEALPLEEPTLEDTYSEKN